MANRPPRILKGEGGEIVYFSAEKVVDIMTGINEFRRYKEGVESDAQGRGYTRDEAIGMRTKIESIMKIVPGEIRGELPVYYGLSDNDLGMLVDKCDAVLGGDSQSKIA